MSLKSILNLEHEYEPEFVDVFNRSKAFNSKSLQHLFVPHLGKQLFEKGFQPEYPDNKDFAIAVSHDLDIVFGKQIKDRTHSILHRVGADKLLGIKDIYRKSLLGYVDPREFLKTNKQFGIDTTFFMLCLAEGEQDYNYDLSDMDFLFSDEAVRNSEFQLHGGHEAYNNKARLQEEQDRFERYFKRRPTGYRNHFLRFSVPQTWNILEELGYKYDSTMGYAEMPGFRNGICYPFNPVVNGKALKLFEIPLVIMDATLFGYCRLSIADSFKIVKRIIDNVKRYKGAVSLLWHNDYVKEPYLSHYKSILEMIQEQNGWITTAGSLVAWWEKKGYGKQLKDKLNEIE